MLLKWKKERQQLLDIIDDLNAEIQELQRDVNIYRANTECLKKHLHEAHDELERQTYLKQMIKKDGYNWLKKYEREQDKRKELQNNLATLIKHIDSFRNEGN